MANETRPLPFRLDSSSSSASSPYPMPMVSMFEEDHDSSMGERVKSFMTRPRRVTRQSSKMSISTLLDGRSTPNPGAKLTKNSWRTELRGDDSHTRLKNSISSPFDFKHVNHFQRNDVKRMDSSALQTAMSSPEIPQTAQFPIRSMSLAEETPITTPNMPATAPPTMVHNPTLPSVPHSPVKQRRMSRPMSRPISTFDNFAAPVSPPNGLKTSRSVESFSRPLSRAASSSPKDNAKHSPTHSIMRTPVASRSPPVMTGDFSEFQFDTQESPAQAISTPDDSALHMRPVTSPPSTWNSELEDVPEEEPSHAYMPAYAESLVSPVLGHFAMAGSMSRLALSSRDSHSSSIRGLNAAYPTNSMLSAPFHYRTTSVSSVNSKAGELLGLDASWEEDIDYCYDHAAEADCNFDWERGSAVYMAPSGAYASKLRRSVSTRKHDRANMDAAIDGPAHFEHPRRAPAVPLRPHAVQQPTSQLFRDDWLDSSIQHPPSRGNASSTYGTAAGPPLTIPTGTTNATTTHDKPSPSVQTPTTDFYHSDTDGGNFEDEDEVIRIRRRFLAHDSDSGSGYSGFESTGSGLSHRSSDDSFMQALGASMRFANSSTSSLPDLVHSRNLVAPGVATVPEVSSPPREIVQREQQEEISEPVSPISVVSDLNEDEGTPQATLPSTATSSQQQGTTRSRSTSNASRKTRSRAPSFSLFPPPTPTPPPIGHPTGSFGWI